MFFGEDPKPPLRRTRGEGAEATARYIGKRSVGRHHLPYRLRGMDRSGGPVLFGRGTGTTARRRYRRSRQAPPHSQSEAPRGGAAPAPKKERQPVGPVVALLFRDNSEAPPRRMFPRVKGLYGRPAGQFSVQSGGRCRANADDKTRVRSGRPTLSPAGQFCSRPGINARPGRGLFSVRPGNWPGWSAGALRFSSRRPNRPHRRCPARCRRAR